MAKKQEVTCDREGDIAVMKIQLHEVHTALMGNGRPGLLERFNKMEGGVAVWKWAAGSGLIASMTAILTLFMGVI